MSASKQVDAVFNDQQIDNLTSILRKNSPSFMTSSVSDFFDNWRIANLECRKIANANSFHDITAVMGNALEKYVQAYNSLQTAKNESAKCNDVVYDKRLKKASLKIWKPIEKSFKRQYESLLELNGIPTGFWSALKSGYRQNFR